MHYKAYKAMQVNNAEKRKKVIEITKHSFKVLCTWNTYLWIYKNTLELIISDKTKGHAVQQKFS